MAHVTIERGESAEIRRRYARAMQRARVERFDTQSEAAEALGLSQATYSNYERGVRFPRSPAMRDRIEQVLGVSLDDFLGSPAVDADVDALPLLGSVCAGTPRNPSEAVLLREYADGRPGSEARRCAIGRDLYEWALRKRSDPVCVCQVSGDSMEGRDGYADGDLLIVERTEDTSLFRDGDHLIIDLEGDGSCTLKKYLGPERNHPDGLHLLAPINAEAGFRPLALHERHRLWGIVIASLHVRR